MLLQARDEIGVKRSPSIDIREEQLFGRVLLIFPK